MTLYLSTTLDKHNGIQRTFTKEDDDILDDENGPISQFRTAIIEDNTEWLVYEGDRYNDKPLDGIGGSKRPGKFMKLGKGTHELTFQPKSVRPLKFKSTWYIYLFEHANYGGEMHEYYYQNTAIKEFPTGTSAGISAIIIPPNNTTRSVQFYLGIQYQGSMFTLKPGYYPNLDDYVGVDERIQSFKMV